MSDNKDLNINALGWYGRELSLKIISSEGLKYMHCLPIYNWILVQYVKKNLWLIRKGSL